MKAIFKKEFGTKRHSRGRDYDLGLRITTEGLV